MSQPPYGNQPPYGGQPPFGGQPSGGSQSGWGQPGPAGPSGYGQPPTGAQPGYGQPQTGAQPSFGQPTQQFGQPAFGGGGYGSPPGGQPPYGGGPGSPYGAPPPSKKSPLPFIIIGLVVLLMAGGAGLFFALKDDEPTPVADPTTSQTTESTADTNAPTEDTDTPTEDTDTDSPGGDEPNFADSEDTAITFMQLMVDGEYDTARTSLCDDGKEMFANGQELADDFFGFIGATTITGGETTDVYADPDESDRDVVAFDLETDVGTVPLIVSILEENGTLTICGYDTP